MKPGDRVVPNEKGMSTPGIFPHGLPGVGTVLGLRVVPPWGGCVWVQWENSKYDKSMINREWIKQIAD